MECLYVYLFSSYVIFFALDLCSGLENKHLERDMGRDLETENDSYWNVCGDIPVVDLVIGFEFLPGIEISTQK